MIYLQLFLTFLKIGAFTFGGGYAMLPFIQQEVLAHGWLTQEQLLNFIAISESTPGPFAVNVSTYVGAQTAGVFGAFCATFGVVLPPFVIILIIAKLYTKFSKNQNVEGAMTGLKGTVVGLIGAAVLSTAKSIFLVSGVSILSPLQIIGILLFIACFLLLMLKKINPIWIIVGSGVFGILVRGFLG